MHISVSNVPVQVPPAELEALILTMDVIKDAIVIPVVDEEAGEVCYWIPYLWIELS